MSRRLHNYFVNKLGFVGDTAVVRTAVRDPAPESYFALQFLREVASTEPGMIGMTELEDRKDVEEYVNLVEDIVDRVENCDVHGTVEKANQLVKLGKRIGLENTSMPIEEVNAMALGSISALLRFDEDVIVKECKEFANEELEHHSEMVEFDRAAEEIYYEAIEALANSVNRMSANINDVVVRYKKAIPFESPDSKEWLSRAKSALKAAKSQLNNL